MRSKSSAGPFFSSTRRAMAPSSRSQSTSAVMRLSSPSLSSRAIHSRMSTKLIDPASLSALGALGSCDRLDPHALEAGLRLEQVDQTLLASRRDPRLQRQVNAMLVDASLVLGRRDRDSGLRENFEELRGGRTRIGEDQRDLSPALIVLVLEAAQHRERHDADQRRRRAQDVHARAGGEPDGGHQPETGGGRQSLDAGTGPEDRAAAEESDAGDDRRRDARGVDVHEIVRAVVLEIDEVRRHEHERGRRQRHDDMGAEAGRPAVDVPLVADDAAERGPDDQADQELSRRDHAPSAGATSPRKRLNWPTWSHEPKRSAMWPTPASKYARSSWTHRLGSPEIVHCSTNSREKFDV